MDLKNLPTSPGIYRFLNQEGEIIYIGKAKNLKKRVKSYFNPKIQQSLKNQVMIKKIHDIKCSVVSSDLEAYLLETNLIKQHRPKYNILMKDDKNFAYLKVTTQEDFPKLFLERKISDNKSTYIGPKTSTTSFKMALDILNKIFFKFDCQIGYETIKQGKASAKQIQKPICQIKQLDANHSPCISDLSKEEYQKVIQIIIDFFKGKNLQIKELIQQQMLEFATNKEFEKAAKYRDKLQTLESIIQKQKIISTNIQSNLDIINCYSISNEFYFCIILIREGKILEIKNLQVQDNLESIDIEVFQQFLIQYYTQTQDYPQKILCPLTFPKEFQNHLENLSQQKLKLQSPQIGDKSKLLDLAFKNAKLYAQKHSTKWLHNQKQGVLENLKTILNLKKLPKRIECYDVSHLAGTHTKASMVVFENAMPLKSDYRYFNIQSLKANKVDDYQSMHEALKRRLKYIAQLPKGWKLSKSKLDIRVKKDKKNMFHIKFKEVDKYLELSEITQDKDQHQIDSTILKLSCDKFKNIKKIYLNPNLKLDKTLLIQAGFKEIQNSQYQYCLIKEKEANTSFKQKPDLIVIDGGKGQLKMALDALRESNLEIPIISLAKKFETIYKSNKEPVHLAYTDPSLKLIQHLRDEAHRFAISQNRKARLKEIN